MNRIALSLFLVALTTLMAELALVRIFDVIWHANKAYMIITMVMFCFGLSGVQQSLWPVRQDGRLRAKLAGLAFFFGLFLLALLPAINSLPLNLANIQASSGKDIAAFAAMYLLLSAPFFLSGLFFTIIFSAYSKDIQRLYFWDLAGAALGCLILIPFLPHIGPAGALFLGGGLCWITAGLLAESRLWPKLLPLMGIAAAAIPLVKSFTADNSADRYFEFRHHVSKRGVLESFAAETVEISRWDPISKIDVINTGGAKHIAYDGGTQSSFIYPFDGDYARLRAALPDATTSNFGGQNVYLSHWLKRDSGQEVLIIGAAGGQETKAALTFGAKHVDAVELVGFVVKIGKELYKDFNGGIFTDPRVTTHVDEGRSFLRASDKHYDIIQIYSNHTSSSIAAGSGAMATSYLQTAEAYTEYFQRLKPDGILHINHHVYPRMVTTAAKAWKDMGRTDFRRHVLVFQAKDGVRDNLPTLLIRMTPWTEAEVVQLRTWFRGHTRLAEDPFQPEQSMLSDEFYSGELSKATAALVPFRVTAATDNRPYFNFLRKRWDRYNRSYPEQHMDYSTAALLSSQYLSDRVVPNDLEHLVIVSAASLLFALIFVLVPLLFSKAGRTRWPGKLASLGYFSCLGGGFIIVELVFIQIFMKLIGFPLHTYSAVVFAMLIAAALGSLCSGKMGISPQQRWLLPFAGTILSVLLFIAVYPAYFSHFLAFSIWGRVAAAVLLILPAGFFMGMCFPLGILAVSRQPEGAVAWAWGMNGLFTVIGGIASVLISIYLGFNLTLLAAVLIYALALVLFMRMREAAA
uniref:spermine/spermidine synthase domain-containing protein n=1 Tax=Candidatus Electronema sp. TaxID=2698783 RepID=UPI004055ED64